MWQQFSPLPIPIPLYPLLSFTLSSPLPLQYLSRLFLPVPAGETRALRFSAWLLALLQHPPVPLVSSLPPSSLCLPLWGFAGQPASLAVAAAAGAVELFDTTLLRLYCSASLLSAFCLTLCFAG